MPVLKAVHQLVPFLAAANATTPHALRLRSTLRAAGFVSEIYAEDAEDSYANEARPFNDLTERISADVFIYQYWTESAITAWLSRQHAPVILNYHNITPAEFFQPWDAGGAASLRRARDQLKELAPRPVASLAVSRFNATELVELGFRAVSVAPLLQAERTRVQPDATMARDLGSYGTSVHWISVGRITPNKCQHDVVRALAAYRDRFDARARLTLVGRTDCEPYLEFVRETIVSLGLQSIVRLTSQVTDEELVAIYGSSDVYVCLSEHEGVCLPVVEAMQLGIPVVAAARAALPEIIGEGGILLDDKDPVAVASAVHRVTTDAPIRQTIGDAARAQVVKLAAGEGAYVDTVRAVLAKGAHSG